MDANKLFAFEDRTQEFDPQDIQTNKAMGILAYIGPLVFIPMCACKQSKFAQFNSEAGVMLFIAEVILGALGFIPYLGILFYLLEVGVSAIAIMGIVYAATGKAMELPIVSQCKFIKLMK